MKEFIEKLIDRLEKEKIIAFKTYRAFDMNTDLGRMFGIEKSIKIINELVEEYNNDFCEWQPNKQFNWFLKSPHEGVGITQEEKGFFKFCPCCGKKIKVVE